MFSIVVVGGGFAGVVAAKKLQESGRFEVVLIDRKDYFEVTLAQLRALVSGEQLAERSRIPYSEILGDSFVHGEVARVEDKSVVVDGRHFSYDTLVLAPGTRYPRFDVAKPTGQTTLDLRRDHSREQHTRFREAPGYLVIGGGLVGVELAGELASFSGGKKVRLAHRGPRLVENLPPKVSALVLAQLTAMGVLVELNTPDAQRRDGELVYETISPLPATDFLKSVEPGVLDGKGRIVVDSHLRVVGHPHWYAVGDANDFPDAKQAITAQAQALYLVKSLLSARPGRAKPYRAQPPMALTSLGLTHGFALLPFGVVTWNFLINIKRKDLLVSRFRKDLGASEAHA